MSVCGRRLAPQIASDADLDAAVLSLLPIFNLVETEESWDRIDNALAHFQTLTKNGATKVPSYIARAQEIAPCITRSVCIAI